MDYRTVGQSDLRVSSLGMGCVTFGREIDRLAAFEILDYATEQGINLLDTAAAYGNGASESVVGEWIADRRSRTRVLLATKVHGSLQENEIIESLENSLKRLRTDCVDLFQLHLWNAHTPLSETLNALDKVVRQGKARYVGCSNWKAWQMCKALVMSAKEGNVRFESIQPPYNLVQREIEAELLPLCSDQHIGVISYSPLAAGFLTGKYRQGQSIPKGTRFDVMPGHQPIYFTPSGFETLARLDQLALTTGRSRAQLALAWVLRQSAITCMLFGARSRAHVDQALEARRASHDPEVIESLAKW